MEYLKQSGGEYFVEFDADCYSLQAITFATYDFVGMAFMRIEKSGNKKIQVFLSTKNQSNKDLSDIASSFFESVLDHQVRIKVNNEFKVIREILVAQAFQPCDNLNNVTDIVEHE